MNFLIIVLDTQRRDHLGCYGYPRDTSPVLDALAEEGVVFENCVTNTAHTMPTFTTMITGQGPQTHGIVSTLYAHPNEPGQRLDDTTPVLPEMMRDGGYLTAAFDNLHDFGCYPAWFARGYHWYVNTWAPRAGHPSQVRADEINERLVPWLVANAKADPWFLFVHYWDPHQAYNQLEPYRQIHSGGPQPERMEVEGRGYIPHWGWEDRLDEQALEKIDLYNGELTFVDDAIGNVLEVLKEAGVYDDTTVIVTADHGEDMQEHNSPFEHRVPYETTVGVPLIVRPADGVAFEPGRRVSDLVGQIDLMPSVLEMAEVEGPENMDGQSWASLLHTDAPTAGRQFLTGSVTKQDGLWMCPEVGVRTVEYKYLLRGTVAYEDGHPPRVYASLGAPPWRGNAEKTPRDRVEFFNALPRRELYDLRTDPFETVNVCEQNPDVADELDEWVRKLAARKPERFVLD